MRFLVAAAMTALVASAALAQDARRLGAAEVVATVGGRTLSGNDPTGCTFQEYLGSDGSAAARCGERTEIGRWEVLPDGRLCVQWSRRQGLSCVEMFRRGSELLMRDTRAGAALRPIAVAPGDTRR